MAPTSRQGQQREPLETAANAGRSSVWLTRPPVPNIGAGIIVNQYSTAISDKRTYTEKLEDAQGDDIFKYLLLINRSALDADIAQARLQTDQSFTLSRRLALGGFVLLSVGIALGVASSITGEIRLDGAYLAAIAGALTQFIAGVMFYMYNRTLQQLNRFHDKMVPSERISMAFLASSQMTNSERDAHRAQLAKSLMDQSASK